MNYYNGDRYEGDYKNGKREGKGIFYLNIFFIFLKFIKILKYEVSLF